MKRLLFVAPLILLAAGCTFAIQPAPGPYEAPQKEAAGTPSGCLPSVNLSGPDHAGYYTIAGLCSGNHTYRYWYYGHYGDPDPDATGTNPPVIRDSGATSSYQFSTQLDDGPTHVMPTDWGCIKAVADSVFVFKVGSDCATISDSATSEQ